MTTIYNLFYDGLPQELQRHIYSYDSTYIDTYNKSIFRNEIKFVHKLRVNYDLPSFVIQCPCDKTGEDLECLMMKVKTKLNDPTVFYPYKHTVSNTEGVAFETYHSELDHRILRLQFYHRKFPVSFKLIPTPHAPIPPENRKLSADEITEMYFTKLTENVTQYKFPDFRWPFYENRNTFRHTYDIRLWPKMSMFQLIFRNDWTFGEIIKVAKLFKEEGFGLMYIEDYESCINSLRGMRQNPMFML